MQIAFVTANYFARASGYRSSIAEWGAAERRVIETFSLAEFDRICADIAGAGFRPLELWQAHAFPKFMTPYLADELKAIMQRHGLTPMGFACGLGDPAKSPRWTRLCFETCKLLGLELITSGISAEAAPGIYEYCREYGIKVAVENHPEKHPEEIRRVIGDFGDWIGACVDTGWFGTQGYPAHAALRHLKDHLFHVHLKDVQAAGGHHTVALGTGVVDLAACVQVLREIGYAGYASIEHEAESHDPTAECAAGRRWVESLLQA